MERPPGRGEAPPHHGLEELEGRGVVAGVEAVLVVGGAEVRAGLPVGVVAVAVAQVPIEPEVMKEVIALENPVVLYDPVVLLGHERRDDHRGELRVVQAGERVTDVVHQRAHHVLLVASVAVRAGSGLQAVGEPVDRVPARVTGEQGEVTEDPVGQPLREAERVPGDDGVVFGRGVHHAREGGLEPVVGAHSRPHTPPMGPMETVSRPSRRRVEPPGRIDHAECASRRRPISAMQRFMAELGGKILFTSGKDRDTDLWCLDLGAQGLRQLTSGNWRNGKGRWSPDGKRIAYVSGKLGGSDLWVMDASGDNATRLTTDNRWYDHPAWSPDGRRIACGSNREGSEDNEIWVLTLADGSWT